MSIELKIKSKHLSEEAKIIRFEERKLFKQYQWSLNNYRAAGHNDMYPRWDDKAFMSYSSLNHHRRWDVRNENRATFLARAYIAGVPYSNVERKRKEDKEKAQEEYNKLKNALNNEMNESEKQEIIYQMEMLKKKFVYINKNDVENVKMLIKSYGATYYDASGEADELCVMLNIKHKVWGCLSEDMDMFVYGCPRVIRYLSLLNHTAVVYDVKGILNNLGITQKELREICVLSGTDYNIECHDTPNILNTNLKLFKKYHKSNKNITFYEWLNENKKNYIKDYDLLLKICNIFDLNVNNNDDINAFEKLQIVNGPILKDDVKNILKADGFIFAVC
jgi:hypothetical protein